MLGVKMVEMFHDDAGNFSARWRQYWYRYHQVLG